MVLFPDKLSIPVNGREAILQFLTSVCLGPDALQSSHPAMSIRGIHIWMDVTATHLSHDDGQTWT